MKLVYLLELLDPITSKWHAFGIQLGVKPDKLQELETHKTSPVRDYMREMLECWLQKSTSATMQDILNALRKPVLGEMRLSKELEKKYKGTHKCLLGLYWVHLRYCTLQKVVLDL